MLFWLLKKGLSNCRNAILRTAFADSTVDAVLMMDDDSFADSRWLEKWDDHIGMDDSLLCGGPTEYIFPPESNDLVRSCSMFRSPLTQSGPAKILRSSNNLLIRRELYERFGPGIFSLDFNQTGGRGYGVILSLSEERNFDVLVLVRRGL